MNPLPEHIPSVSDEELSNLIEMVTNEDKSVAKTETWNLLEGVFRAGIFHLVTELVREYQSLTQSNLSGTYDENFGLEDILKSSYITKALVTRICNRREEEVTKDNLTQLLTKNHN